MIAGRIQPTTAIQIDLADGVNMSAYGSPRLGYESVKSDKEAPQLNGYTGFLDAYSRVASKASYPLNDDITAYIQYETPLGLANTHIGTPDDRIKKIRIANFQLSGDSGNVWVSQDWLPYYNAIYYKADLFDSYEASELV